MDSSLRALPIKYYTNSESVLRCKLRWDLPGTRLLPASPTRGRRDALTPGKDVCDKFGLKLNNVVILVWKSSVRVWKLLRFYSSIQEIAKKIISLSIIPYSYIFLYFLLDFLKNKFYPAFYIIPQHLLIIHFQSCS